MMELERARYILAVEENRKAQLEEATRIVAEADDSVDDFVAETKEASVEEPIVE